MDALRAARELAGLTQAQLAERAGVAQQTISHLENGVIKSPSFHLVSALAGVLKVAPVRLFGPRKPRQSRATAGRG